MKNEAREAVANLRETLDRLVIFFGLDLEDDLDPVDWQEFVMEIAPQKTAEDLAWISKAVAEMDKQVDILEAIDDNDIMEHAYSQTKDWEPGEVYNLYPVEDDPDTLRMEQVQPEDC